MAILIYGQGIYLKGEYRSAIKGVDTKEYKLWHSMLERCYREPRHKAHASYFNCTVSEDFKYFQMFAGWCNEQIGFGKFGWQLDKDILIRGNRVYSKESCVFVPRHINCIIRPSQEDKGEFLTGVRYCKVKKLYKAQGDLSKRAEIVGYYESEGEAHSAYKRAKKEYIRQIAEKYKLVIDPRVYLALIGWEV